MARFFINTEGVDAYGKPFSLGALKWDNIKFKVANVRQGLLWKPAPPLGRGR
jgi:hypothetical protein